MGKSGVGVALLTFVLVASAVHLAHGAGPLIAPDCATDAAALAAAKKRPTAQRPVGNAEAGKKHWAFGNTSCLNCHGSDAQGAFAPTLAGRKLPFDVVINQIRKPCGIMPAFIPSQLTDQEIADMVAFWNSMPLPKNAAPWRVALPPGAPKGQELAIATVGCAQCHLATVPTPRHGLAEVNGDWEWYKRQVYQHQTAIREQWRQLDPTMLHPTPGPAGPPGRDRVRMGNYDRTKVPESRNANSLMGISCSPSRRQRCRPTTWCLTFLARNATSNGDAVLQLSGQWCFLGSVLSWDIRCDHGGSKKGL